MWTASLFESLKQVLTYFDNWLDSILSTGKNLFQLSNRFLLISWEQLCPRVLPFSVAVVGSGFAAFSRKQMPGCNLMLTCCYGVTEEDFMWSVVFISCHCQGIPLSLGQQMSPVMHLCIAAWADCAASICSSNRDCKTGNPIDSSTRVFHCSLEGFYSISLEICSADAPCFASSSSPSSFSWSNSPLIGTINGY